MKALLGVTRAALSSPPMGTKRPCCRPASRDSSGLLLFALAGIGCFVTEGHAAGYTALLTESPFPFSACWPS